MFQVHLGAASSTTMDDGMSEPIILNAEPPLAILGTDSPEYTNSIELSVNSSVKPWEYLIGYSNESLSSRGMMKKILSRLRLKALIQHFEGLCQDFVTFIENSCISGQPSDIPESGNVFDENVFTMSKMTARLLNTPSTLLYMSDQNKVNAEFERCRQESNYVAENLVSYNSLIEVDSSNLEQNILPPYVKRQKLFRCSTCQFSCHTKRRLCLHMKTKHGAIQKVESQSTDDHPSKSEDSHLRTKGVALKRCSLCEFSTETNVKLAHHKKLIHQNEPEFFVSNVITVPGLKSI